MFILIAWIALCFLTGWIASNKGRSAVGFFFLSFFLSPLIGVLVALLTKADPKAVEARTLSNGAAVSPPFLRVLDTVAAVGVCHGFVNDSQC